MKTKFLLIICTVVFNSFSLFAQEQVRPECQKRYIKIDAYRVNMYGIFAQRFPLETTAIKNLDAALNQGNLEEAKKQIKDLKNIHEEMSFYNRQTTNKVDDLIKELKGYECEV